MSNYKSPIGILSIQLDEKKVYSIEHKKNFKLSTDPKTHLEKKIHSHLDEYFEGKKRGLNFPVKMDGTNFQAKVWKAISKIPYGKTTTYSELAKKVGRPGAARAVGTACGKNPFLILVPCHRVLPQNGGLGGYSAGGVKNKEFLLRLESSP